MTLTSRSPGLDALRALAIVLVFLYHYRLFPHPAWLDTFADFGWTGVDLFFVLSGYLIANQVFRAVAANKFSLKAFILRRALRILPAYWMVLALYFLLPGFREWERPAPLWKFLSFTQNIGLDLRSQRTFSHAWSLCIEEQFYFLFPLAVLAFSYLKAGGKAVLLLPAFFLAGVVARAVCWQHFAGPLSGTDTFWAMWYKWVYYPTWNRLDGLLTGISIAWAMRYSTSVKLWLQAQSGRLPLYGLCLLASAWFVCREATSLTASVFGFPIVAIGYGCFVASAACERSPLNRLKSGALHWLAVLSYALYLVHKATIHLAQAALSETHVPVSGNIAFFACICASVAGAVALYLAVERPFLQLRRRLIK